MFTFQIFGLIETIDALRLSDPTASTGISIPTSSTGAERSNKKQLSSVMEGVIRFFSK